MLKFQAHLALLHCIHCVFHPLAISFYLFTSLWEIFLKQVNQYKPISQSCTVAKTEKYFWLATGQWNLSDKRLAATKASKVWFSYSHNCTLSSGAIFHSVCQVWLSSGPPESVHLCYVYRSRVPDHWIPSNLAPTAKFLWPLSWTRLANRAFAWWRHLTTTTRMHFAAIFVMQICVTHERFFTKEKTEYNSLPQSILVLVVKWRHTNVLFASPYSR